MDAEVSRRELFGLAVGAAIGLGLAGSMGTAAAAQEVGVDSYDSLRQTAVRLLTGGNFDPADPDYRRGLDALDVEVGGYWQTLDRSATRTALWPDLPLTGTDAVNANLSLNQLRSLATVWATNGAALFANADVLAEVISGLAFIYQRRYHESAAEVGNWWNWEIGAPRALAQTCLLIGDHLSASASADYLRAIGKFVPTPDRRTNAPSVLETGANRMDKCVIVAMSGILGRDPARMTMARDGLSDVSGGGKNSIFQYVESGDGFYRDGSFIQHSNIAYVGTYGNVLLADVGYLLALLAGSPWQVDDPNLSVVLDAVSASFAPFISNGRMMDCVRGRAIARDYESDHDDGRATIASMLLLAAGAPASYAATFRSLAKGWMLRDTALPYLEYAAVPDLGLAKQILGDTSIAAIPEPSYHRQFSYQDRIVHRRPKWSFTVGLSSARTARYEAGNAENLHGWYVGDGVTYLYDQDLGQYSDGFWPTVNAYRLPGTTVQNTVRTRADNGGWVSPAGLNSWVGGTTDGHVGAAGMDLRSYDSALTAKKSWFCVDDAVICLGAGVTRSGAQPATVESTVDNRNLHAAGTNRLLINGRERAIRMGQVETVANAKWAHLYGLCGYAFGAETTLHALREERTATWFDIDQGADTGGSQDPITRRYATIWFDHGVDPTNASYVYALIPGATVAQTLRWSALLPTVVAANTAIVQAIRQPAQGILMANFWAAGQVDQLVSSGPSSVVVRRNGSRISVAVSDPSRTQEVTTVRLPYPARHVVHADASVTVVKSRPFAELKIATGGSSGRTHAATFTI
jgi:hyaluronate lyase